MTPLPITRVGDQYALLLPEEMLTQLAASDLSEIQAISSPNGFELIANREKAQQLEAARQVMREDREALGKLAE